MAPKKKSRKKKTKSTNSKNVELEKMFDELISLIIDTSTAKGWKCFVKAKDEKKFRYATLSFYRYEGNEEITGNFELTCDEVVKLVTHPTSFHKYGISDLKDAVWNEICKLPWLGKKDTENKKGNNFENDIVLIERFLRRFHRTTRQLKNRHDDRTAFLIKDEYDVQDLLHAFFRGIFDDVRAEEHTPSYAGGSSRIDFLLKSQEIALEVKFASSKLKDKQIGDQLIIDIGRYKEHPNCKRLICFVYDPEGYLKNPDGLETDLSKVHDGLEVKVIIVSP